MSTITKKKNKLVYHDDSLLVYKTFFNHSLVDYAGALAKNKPFILLDSASKISETNRWSFLAAFPQGILNFKSGRLISRESGVESREKEKQNPFNLLRDFFDNKKSAEWQELDFSPYIGGPVGFISYDAARYIEKLPSLAEDDLKLPDFYFIRPTVVLAHDIQKDELFIYLYRFSKMEAFADIAEIRQILKGTPLPRTGTSLFGDTPAVPLIEAGMSPLEQRCPHIDGCSPEEGLESNLSKEQFETAVQKIRDYIYAGDVYQVNLSQRFEANFTGDNLALYKHLREVNPSPFCAYLKAAGFSLLSSSPERLVCLSGNKAQTRPIAGTRRRGQNDTEDGILSGNLLLDEKERAEHIMLVDLERNDLGKVSNYDSVHVSDLMMLEKYSHVIHIVSNVCGELYPSKDCFDLIKAMFPGGTITGCPKVRCMEIIEELEPTRRGPYTGSLGYFSYNGNIDFNILIRTIVETNSKVYIQAGAGIVADSKPEREYYECISKAQALFKSIGHTLQEKQWEKMST